MSVSKIFKSDKRPRQGHKSAEAHSMGDWFCSALGRKVFEAEKYLVEDIIPRLFGYHILQIGLEEHQDFISDSPAGHKIMFSAKWSPGITKPVANCEKLPLRSNTIDSIVLYHALDFTNDSHELLREVTRVLRPGGKMLIIGFNPLSAWGFWRLLKRKKILPWKGRFLSVSRLSDWLRLLDLQIITTESAVHFLPFNSRRILYFADTFEKFGRKMKSPFGGSYYIQCIKQVSPVTPIVTLSRSKKMRSTSPSIPITEKIKIKTIG